eukprot:3587017-Prorocentrum_lima.AAC.1
MCGCQIVTTPRRLATPLHAALSTWTCALSVSPKSFANACNPDVLEHDFTNPTYSRTPQESATTF